MSSRTRERPEAADLLMRAQVAKAQLVGHFLSLARHTVHTGCPAEDKERESERRKRETSSPPPSVIEGVSPGAGQQSVPMVFMALRYFSVHGPNT